MSRPTFQQLEALADFLGQNPGIAKGLLRTAHAKQDTKRKWEEVASNLNALGGAQKDGRGWAKYWADKKCALKKTCAQHAQSMRRTGGGPAEALPSLTPIDQRLVAVMGGLEFAVGDSHVAINPFPRPSIAAPVPEISNPYNELEIQSMESIPMQEENSRNEEIMVPDSAVQTADSVTVHTTPLVSQQERERSPVNPHRISRHRYRARQANSLNQDRDQFAAIERQRVEAETVTARALREAVDTIPLIASAINNLATAVTEAAQIIAQAMGAAANTQQ